jgi:hypothetical protein
VKSVFFSKFSLASAIVDVCLFCVKNSIHCVRHVAVFLVDCNNTCDICTSFQSKVRVRRRIRFALRLVFVFHLWVL